MSESSTKMEMKVNQGRLGLATAIHVVIRAKSRAEFRYAIPTLPTKLCEVTAYTFQQLHNSCEG